MPLRGQGEHGSNNGSPGDLYIRINAASSKIFKRQGFDIYLDYHLDMIRATMGTEIKVPTVDGDVKYTVPAGTQPGTLFRLKGKGVPRVNSSGRGDQYVNVIVDIPKSLNDKQREALNMFLEASGEKVSDSSDHKDKDKKGFMGKIFG
jgi:molecular chaperone DnaJ